MITQITSQYTLHPKYTRGAKRNSFIPFSPTNSNTFGILNAPFHDMSKPGMFLSSCSSTQAQKLFCQTSEVEPAGCEFAAPEFGNVGLSQDQQLSTFSLLALF